MKKFIKKILIISFLLFSPTLFAKKLNIKISGNETIKKEEILALADSKSFDLDNFVKKLITYYKDKGYLYVNVKIVSSRDDEIEILIEENELIFIGSISLEKIKNIKDNELRELYEAEALDAINLNKGDVLEKKRIEESIISFKEWLLDNNFIFSKDVGVDTSVSFKTKQADVLIKANYGHRVRVGLRDNKEFTKRELQQIASGVREFTSQENYIKAILNKLEQKYRNIGFANIKIKPIVKIDADKSIINISFLINEGKRVMIEKMNFSGIHSMTREELMNAINREPYEFINNRIFHKEEIDKAGAIIERTLKENGYLSANLNFIQMNFDKKKNSVKIKYLFTEGTQTKINSLKVEGLSVIDREKLWKILEIKKGKPFNIFSFEGGLAALKDEYYNMGYLDFKVLNLNSPDIVRYNSDQNKADIFLKLHEGLKIRVRNIIIEGNKKTKDKVIRREIPLKKGDALEQKLIERAESNLQELDLFNLVSIRLIKVKENDFVRDVLVTVEDGPAGILEFGPGFRNDLGLRFFGAISYRNLGGWNRSITVDGFVNRRLDVDRFRFLEYNVDLGFKEPYFFGEKLDFLLDIIFLRRQLNTFDVNVRKINFEFSKKVTKKLTLFLLYSYENIETFNAINENDNENSNIASISPGFRFDSTDSSFNPSRGFRVTARTEWASPAFGSEESIGYHRFTSNNTLFLPIVLNSIWKLGLSFGFERSNIQGQEIPNIKLFRLGGVRSIRGYEEDSLEVDSRLNIEGTLSFLNYRTEIQTPLDGGLGLAFFWDAGNLYVDTIRPFDLRQSAGIGLRYRTPVGPISLDYARKLGNFRDRGDGINATGQERHRIHLSIGSF